MNPSIVINDLQIGQKVYSLLYGFGIVKNKEENTVSILFDKNYYIKYFSPKGSLKDIDELYFDIPAIIYPKK